MKKLLLLLIFFYTLNSFGQTFEKIKVTSDSDTTFWIKYLYPIIEKLNLIELTSPINFLRVSSFKYYLELTKDSAKVIFYVREIWDSKQTGESFIKSFILDQGQILKIYKLYDSLGIIELPSDKFIKKWGHGFDGITYIIENKIGNNYSFKNYWTPTAQEKFEESENLVRFTNDLDSLLNYKEKSKLFESAIPFYSWTYEGSIAIAIRIISKKEFKKYRRKKNKQLQNAK